MKRLTAIAAVAISLSIFGADIKINSDQLAIEGMSFPREKLVRFLAARDTCGSYNFGTFHRGFAAPAPSRVDIRVEKTATRFDANFAIGKKSKDGKAVFRVLADGKEVWNSGVVKFDDGRKKMGVQLDKVEMISLEVELADGAKPFDWALWGEIEVTYPEGDYPGYDNRKTTRQLSILTPPTSELPRINGPKVYGVRPGHPIIYRIPVTGKSPIKMRVKGENGEELPEGLKYYAARHFLGGSLAEPGDYRVRICAMNDLGTDERTLTIRVGDKICLTPAMGWNSWNAFAESVTAEKIMAAAEAMVTSGLADHGWNYINIDDFWERNPIRAAQDKAFAGPPRDVDGRILTNAHFPDMKALADAVHLKGLRIGLYSSPGPLTCGRCAGSYGHEFQDARTYAEWGFDYLKYDWCSCKQVGDLPYGRMLPMKLMASALHVQNRDIVYSFNSGSVHSEPSSWARSTGANSWRISGDVFDTWTSITAAIDISRRLFLYVEPGSWNDPDMLCVGPVTWNNFRTSRLSPNEQYTHISMWAMLAAPMMIGCDMTKLDAFTLGLLTNDEVIEIDQDELGKAAGCIDAGEGWEIWARPLASGAIAVAIINMSAEEKRINFDMEKAGMLCKWRARDCWRQEDIGVFNGGYTTTLYGHATQLVKFTALPCGKLREDVDDIRDAAWRRLMKPAKYAPNHSNPWSKEWPEEWQVK